MQAATTKCFFLIFSQHRWVCAGCDNNTLRHLMWCCIEIDGQLLAAMVESRAGHDEGTFLWVFPLSEATM